MARIDGIIILDPNGYASPPLPKLTRRKPLITSHFASHPPSYAAVHTDAFNHELARVRASGEQVKLEPVLWVNTLRKGASGTGASGAALCHVERDGLRYLVPISDEVNPLFAFAFLDSFLDTLKSYLGDVTEVAVKDNFDIVYMVSWREFCEE
jgi:AP-3 complex subunit mu